MTALGTQGSSAQAQGRLWSARAEDWATIMEPIGARAVYDDVLRRLAPGSGARLLDAGCGSGVFLELATAAGARASGIDAAPALVEIATGRVPGADVIVGELERLPYDDDAFDLVTGFNSFQYAADPVKALSEAGRVTAAGGRVVAVVWGDKEDCEAAVFIAALGSFLPPPPPGAGGPFALSVEGALEQLVRDAGLEPLELVDVPTPWVFEDEPTAVRGLISAGPAVLAIEAAGEDAVRQAAREALAPFRTAAGGYRLENVFRYVVAAPV